MNESRNRIVLGAIAILLCGGVALMALSIRWSHRKRQQSSAPQSVVVETGRYVPESVPARKLVACPNSRADLRLVIGRDEIKHLHGNDPKLRLKAQFPIKEVKFGDNLTLYEKDRQPIVQSPGLLYRACATVVGIEQNGMLELKLSDKWLGEGRLLARICDDFCDGILDEIPAEIGGHKPLVVSFVFDTAPKDHVGWPGSLTVPFVYEKPFDNDLLNKTDLKGKVLVVYGPSPLRRDIWIYEMMKRIKQAGAAKVYWFYGGMLALNDMPLYPPVPDSVRRMTPLEWNEYRKKNSAQLVLVGSDPRVLDEPFPGSIVVRNSRVTGFPWKPMSAADLEEIERESSFEIEGPPFNAATTYAIYGQSALNWHPLYLISMLRKKGITQLIYLPAGSAGLNEFKLLGMAAK